MIANLTTDNLLSGKTVHSPSLHTSIGITIRTLEALPASESPELANFIAGLSESQVNLDLQDLDYLFSVSDEICIVVAEGKGENRNQAAVEQLEKQLNNLTNREADSPVVILSVKNSPSQPLEWEELNSIADILSKFFTNEPEVLFAYGEDKSLSGGVRVEVLYAMT